MINNFAAGSKILEYHLVFRSRRTVVLGDSAMSCVAARGFHVNFSLRPRGEASPLAPPLHVSPSHPGSPLQTDSCALGPAYRRFVPRRAGGPRQSRRAQEANFSPASQRKPNRKFTRTDAPRSLLPPSSHGFRTRGVRG